MREQIIKEITELEIQIYKKMKKKREENNDTDLDKSSKVSLDFL